MGMRYESLSEIFKVYLILDFRKEEVLDALYNECVMFLDFTIDEDQDLEFLDYDIDVDNKGDKIEIIANNMITGLWFSGIYPSGNLEKIDNNNEYSMNGYKYKYYPNTRRFKVTKIN